VTDAATCVLAPNPSPWTLDGTNTWLLAAPGGGQALIVDPGPLDTRHLAAIGSELAAGDLRATGILLTHGHIDHAESARALGMELGVNVRAVDPAQRLGDEGLAPGSTIALGDREVRIVATPGHSSDSVCLLLDDDGSVLTGDTVLGRGTTVIAWPDGDLGAYLDSLDRLAEAVAAHDVRRLLPGHGPVLEDPAGVLAGYLAHRRARLAEVAAVVAAGVTDPAAVVEIVYAGVPREVWPAAELSVRAQLDYLARR
jgi:glyoxylase-like metal-dependent hydrolase (beta-lactamase superfamily II)